MPRVFFLRPTILHHWRDCVEKRDFSKVEKLRRVVMYGQLAAKYDKVWLESDPLIEGRIYPAEEDAKHVQACDVV